MPKSNVMVYAINSPSTWQEGSCSTRHETLDWRTVLRVERVTNKHLGTRLVCHFQRVFLQLESHPLQAFGVCQNWLSEDCHEWHVVLRRLDNVLPQDVMLISFSCKNDCQTLFLCLSIVALGLGKRSLGLSYWASLLCRNSAQLNVGAIAATRDFVVRVVQYSDIMRFMSLCNRHHKVSPSPNP